MKQRTLGKVVRRLGLVGLLFALACAAWIATEWFRLPDPRPLAQRNPSETAFIRGKCVPGPCRIRWVPLGDISPFVPAAVVLEEDPRFFEHGGVDGAKLWAAVREDLRHRRLVAGGSTITMQLARNLYLGPERTVARKLREILLAKKIERTLSKQRVLELYLNVAEWGPQVFGVEAAAQEYFQKPAADLEPDEASFLASILPNPFLLRAMQWRERFALSGMRVLDTLMSRSLPWDPDVSTCHERLSAGEEGIVDTMVSSFFSAFGLRLLTGEAALMTCAELDAALTAEGRRFLEGLLARAGASLPGREASCLQRDPPEAGAVVPIEQMSGWHRLRAWVPSAAAPMLERLLAKARAEGFPLLARSGYRGCGYQRLLFLFTVWRNRYCLPAATGEEISDRSEHGCLDRGAVDFAVAGDEEIPFEASGAARWLQEEAPALGFVEGRPWHWKFAPAESFPGPSR